MLIVLCHFYSPFLVTKMFLDDLKKEALIHKIKYINILPYPKDRFKSIVVGLLPYYAGEYSSPISRYARGIDYHTVGKEIFTSILSPLSRKYQFSFQVYIDISPINERKVALEAGLGILGRNNLVINEEYGSYCFIATALTDLEVKNGAAPVKKCIDCGACVRNCPGKAIQKDGIDYSRCLSRINQDKHISEREKEMIASHGYLWGCDACQTICPYNRDLKLSPLLPFIQELILNPSDTPFHSNRSFQRKYGRYAFAYKGKGIIQRNMDLITSKRCCRL